MTGDFLMSKDNEQVNHRYKWVHFVVLAMMILLTLYCSVMAIHYHVTRDPVAFVNTAIDLVGLVLVVLLYGFSFSSNGSSPKSKQIFILLILLVFIASFFTTLSDTIYGLPGHAPQVTLYVSLGYFFTAPYFLILWFYQKEFYEVNRKTKTITVLLSLALVVYMGALILNCFTPTTFIITEQGVYDSGFVDYFSIYFDLFSTGLLFIPTVFSKIDLKKKLSFASCALPLIFLSVSFAVGATLDTGIYLIAGASIMTILPLYIIFFNVHVENEKKMILQEKKQIELQIAATISQIQPHFLYNSLAVIAALCEDDPLLAAKATTTFSDYLRENMDFANKSDPISFSEELNHIQTYVWLEELRFSNKVRVQYDIRCTAFPVPALSVQPLVENAIKHGICKKRSGGRVTLTSFEGEKDYTVIIADNGVGFDPEKLPKDDARHIGIASSDYRIREMVGGSLNMESTPGKGTTVTIKIPKGRKKK